MRPTVINVVTKGPVVCICPELDERMRVRTLGAGPVIRRQEQKSQQRQAPEEIEPG
jgi:hypothetical protein